MATLNGAKALGLEKELGTLQAGKLADFCVFNLPDPSPQNVLENFLEQSSTNILTVIDGKVVYENNK